MKIGTREVGPGAPVFVISECGSNHGGSLEAALALVDAAADAGADAAKFQRFRVDSFIVPRANPEPLRPYELPDAWLPVLRDRCAARGMEFLCTAFDLDSLEAVDPYVNAHKIGSYEAAEYEYVEEVLDRGKPTITSLGKFSDYGLELPPWRNEQTIFMVCESKYPADIAGYLRDEHTLMVGPWGVSDHTLDPITVPAAAVALGALVVEKHMMLDYDHGGAEYQAKIDAKLRPPDWPVSISPEDFRRMVEAVMRTSRALGRAS